MKATGIVRRIDDLGIVVYEKSIKQTVNLLLSDQSHRVHLRFPWSLFCSIKA